MESSRSVPLPVVGRTRTPPLLVSGRTRTPPVLFLGRTRTPPVLWTFLSRPAGRGFVRSLLLMLVVSALAGGCAGTAIEPWVKPYERDRLADPIMSFNRHPVASAYMHHVRQAREGARGAEGGGGGGCGCN